MMHRNVRCAVVVATAFILMANVSAWAQKNEGNQNTPDPSNVSRPLMTFVELGSVKCVPCRQMQPVMKAIAQKYGSQISVVFHDVWKPDQKEYITTYEVRVIPTQVFLDKDGKEVFRHEGFFPEAEIDKLVQKYGLKPKAGG
jgi:thioredoxin 1